MILLYDLVGTALPSVAPNQSLCGVQVVNIALVLEPMSSLSIKSI